MRVLVIGGGVAGLATALSLSRAGHAVQVLERDATPLPPSPVEAFERWERNGAPQVWHSHAFLARLRNGLSRAPPDVLEALHAHGADDLHFARLFAADGRRSHARSRRRRTHALRVPAHHLRVGAAPVRARESRRVVARRRGSRGSRRRRRHGDGYAPRQRRARARRAAIPGRSRPTSSSMRVAVARGCRAGSSNWVRRKSRRKRRSAGSSTARASIGCGRARWRPQDRASSAPISAT